ncbi:flagellar basal-body MS-ring/collar protein FliF [Buchnera aphidicola]|uniref:Flagellar M-ring protein n=1 Tax=Buchnera aphidicola str. USDA (Myzus persicae) TaxID=1009856 RepID=W0P0N0_BUCMP|nr:flagellar basal-body MS-ring/collar protein FliF [Buchnera aphidicola]AHG60294.1 Flif [Buchnera aphidicola str. USDA (Myzus persicae)]AHG60872.1 Flif [Buchnera aphidicola str. W106 (Myzus persicae)]AHG61444.1 Flif [Buchnera aphidicola str. G002 (Myzus persicae)]AHG62017.1 Flif [Buchnera aphidicola str. F009 (Myzus persicae)]WAI03020.1 MAG: flagellar basal-body MS-ring/collar protein FliF [Buchnera aphidicola (Myzus persicae)]
MNFSAIEDSVLEEKKKFNNFFSRFLKNSRVLIILLTASVITAVSVSIWIKSPEYQVLYNHLSNEDGGAIINQLNQMKIPYQFTDVSGQISVPKNKVYDIRLRLAEKNLPRGGGVGFELLDKEKFGISQFNEQINYQRALEGELARTIQRINIIKNARIHLVFPKSSLFLQDKKKSSASVVLELQPGQVLNSEQINSILHILSSSVSNLSSQNITIVDQFGQLLNQPFLEYQKVNNVQFKYSEDIESRYSNRIKEILEPLVGIGNVHAQVTAQIDFNSQEETQEKYLPNTNHKNQAIRSYQKSIHDQVQKKEIVTSLSNNTPSDSLKNKYTNTMNNGFNFVKNNTKVNNFDNPINSNINRDNTINYELNHSISHTKMNVGEIKRLSAAVIINFTKDKNGKSIPFATDKIKNIEHLIRETIGYSKSRGDSVHVVNALFAKHQEKMPIPLKHPSPLQFSYILFSLTPWFLSALFLCLLLKKYICPVSRNNVTNNRINNEKKYTEKYENIEKNTFQENIKNNFNTDTLIHQICNISNQNPRTIALIIRKWMSDKI